MNEGIEILKNEKEIKFCTQGKWIGWLFIKIGSRYVSLRKATKKDLKQIYSHVLKNQKIVVN